MRLATRFALACAATVAVLVLLAGLGFLRLARVDVLRRAGRATARPGRSGCGRWRCACSTGPVRRSGPRTASTSRSPTAAIALYGNGGWMTVGEHPPVDRLPARRTGPQTVVGGGQRWRAVAVNVAVGRRRGRAAVGVRPARRAAAAARPAAAAGRPGDRLLAVVAGLVGWLVGRAATRPLRRLQHRLARRCPDGRRLRVGGGSGVPEIDEVAAVVDSTLDRYDGQVALTNQALQAARSFAATAAHELRTPLAGIGTNLEVLHRHDDIEPGRARRDPRRPARRAPARGRSAGDAADPGAGRTGDAGAVRAGRPGRTGRRRGRRRPPPAPRRRRSRCAARPTLPVTGWPDGLRCVLDNLLDNAAVHGADPARNRHGPGHARRRTRPSPSRTTDRASRRAAARRCSSGSPSRRGSPGSGLGLTLVAQQVSLHGGTIEIGPAARRPVHA